MEIVIFDTNAYRNLSTDKDFKELETVVQKFKQIEQKENISAMMHPIVIKELLYHVAGERDVMYEKALKALKSMFIHCGDTDKFFILADFDLQISNFFYKVIDKNRERIDLQLGEIVSALSLFSVDATLQKYQFNLKQIREQIQETEHFFKTQLKIFIRNIDPDTEDWTIFQNDDQKRKKALTYFTSSRIEYEIASGYITFLHDNLLSKNLISAESPEQLHRKTLAFIEIFQAPIKLYKEVLKKFLQPNMNFDAKSRENFVWDIHLMFTVGDHILSAMNANIYLVTSDNEMRNAAKLSGSLSKVFSFEEYVEYITGRKANYEN
jgi:hypothetical protein